MNEEQSYEQLRKLGQQLHTPIPEAFWELEVRDKDGRLIQRHKQRSHSWTRNAYNLLFSQLAGKNCDDATFGAGKLSGKNTDGYVKYGNYPGLISSTTMADGTIYGYRGSAAQDTHGIMVGSGLSAEDFEDYALETQIVNGTGAGQLSYVESEAHSITYNSVTRVLKNDLVRYFNNNSGGSIDVNEVALVFHGGLGSTGDFLNSRDRLASTMTVPDTGQLKVTYTIQLTYPA